MKYSYPDYYDKFTCIADKCPDTCCAGWQIVVDVDSLERYRKEGGPYAASLQKGVAYKKGVFRQRKDGSCFFLREDKLCDMYCHLGRESLCDTCANYPRHTEEFENLRENSLSLSCPVVAELLLNHMEPVTFLEKGDEEEEEFEEFDYFLFSALEDARADLLPVLQDRSRTLEERLRIVLLETYRLQVYYDRGELMLFKVDPEKAKESSGKLPDFLKAAKKPVDGEMTQKRIYEKAYDRFEILYGLERLRDSWQELLEDAEELLFKDGYAAYCSKKEQFGIWQKKAMPKLDIQLEQVAVYFFSIYFPGAVYDEWIFGKAAAMAAHVLLLQDLLLARYTENNGQLSGEDVVELVYRYSREVEHSDDNLEQMEQAWSLEAF